MADAISQLATKLVTDPALRDKFRQDPVAIIQNETGVTLSAEQKRKLAARDWSSLDDQQLQAHLFADGIRRWF